MSDNESLAHPSAARFDTVTVPKTGVWIVREGKVKRVEMPEAGEWLIMDNEIREVVQNTRVDYAEDCVGYMIWVKKDD